MIFEVIATHLEDVKLAEQYGADRIELVTGIAEGGLTPSKGFIDHAVRLAAIPINVMLRPHSASYVYSQDDYKVMLDDLAHIRQSGAAGVVFGALTEDGNVDQKGLEFILKEVEDLEVTFHRAFDEIDDQAAALRTLAQYPQIRRVLTSGGRKPAPEAIPEIQQLQSLADELGIRILAGHGLKPKLIASFITKTGVSEVHFGSGVRKYESFHHPIDRQCMQQVRECLDALE